MTPSSLPAEGQALLVVGHGTQDAEGVAEFWLLIQRLQAMRPAGLVEGCFLELAQPSIAAAVDRAVERGAEQLAVVPLVLFAAGHAKRDIPRAVAAAAGRHPRLRVRYCSHLGCHPAILSLSQQRCTEAIGAAPPASDRQTLLLMVGRGSRDADANAEMARFARLRFERRPLGWLELAFLSMAEPSVERALEIAAGLPFPRVVVQPHLLFRGELLQRLRRNVNARTALAPTYNWLVAEHLGPDSLLAEAVLGLAGSVDFQAGCRQ
ncbi:MAG: sirohydrochlorin chelatase [Pirellulales bacterium]